MSVQELLVNMANIWECMAFKYPEDAADYSSVCLRSLEVLQRAGVIKQREWRETLTIEHFTNVSALQKFKKFPDAGMEQAIENSGHVIIVQVCKIRKDPENLLGVLDCVHKIFLEISLWPLRFIFNSCVSKAEGMQTRALPRGRVHY